MTGSLTSQPGALGILLFKVCFASSRIQVEGLDGYNTRTLGGSGGLTK